MQRLLLQKHSIDSTVICGGLINFRLTPERETVKKQVAPDWLIYCYVECQAATAFDLVFPLQVVKSNVRVKRRSRKSSKL